LKGVLAYMVNCINQWQCGIRCKNLLQKISKNSYSLRYVSYVDDTTYRFITNNATGDVFVRSQAMFNWIISYPFMQVSPLINRVDKSLEFSSAVQSYTIQTVQVWKDSKLVGVFLYRMMNGQFSLKYLYYEKKFVQDVFEAIAEHFISLKAQSIQTIDKTFAQWLKPLMLTTKYIEEKQSFSFPNWFDTKDVNIQQGDGDVFV